MSNIKETTRIVRKFCREITIFKEAFHEKDYLLSRAKERLTKEMIDRGYAPTSIIKVIYKNDIRYDNEEMKKYVICIRVIFIGKRKVQDRILRKNIFKSVYKDVNDN